MPVINHHRRIHLVWVGGLRGRVRPSDPPAEVGEVTPDRFLCKLPVIQNTVVFFVHCTTHQLTCVKYYHAGNQDFGQNVVFVVRMCANGHNYGYLGYLGYRHLFAHDARASWTGIKAAVCCSEAPPNVDLSRDLRDQSYNTSTVFCFECVKWKHSILYNFSGWRLGKLCFVWSQLQLGIHWFSLCLINWGGTAHLSHVVFNESAHRPSQGHIWLIIYNLLCSRSVQVTFPKSN